jgi:hypothetical protein
MSYFSMGRVSVQRPSPGADRRFRIVGIVREDIEQTAPRMSSRRVMAAAR